MRITLLILLTITSLFGIDNNQRGLDRYNEREKISKTIFLDIYKKYGTQLRFSSILDACQMNKISNLIEPPQSELLNFAGKNIPKNLTIKDNEFFMSVISTTLSTVRGYQLGYMESTKSLVSIDKNYCKEMTPFILKKFEHKLK